MTITIRPQVQNFIFEYIFTFMILDEKTLENEETGLLASDPTSNLCTIKTQEQKKNVFVL